MNSSDYLNIACDTKPESDLVLEICRKLGYPDGKTLTDSIESLGGGVKFAADIAGIELNNKKILILGSGQTGETLAQAFKQIAFSVTTLSTAASKAAAEAGALFEIEIIIRVPDGSDGEVELDLDKLPNCCGLVDLSSYPCRTALMLRAEAHGLPCVDGLPMLIYRTAHACSTDALVEKDLKRTLRELRKDLCNIVIIGMPGSGKSSVAELISRKTGRKFVNIDTEIVNRVGKPIPEIFADDGEAAFREIEREETARAGALTGAVIATGGGVIKDFRNYAPLHRNGRIYYLRRELTDLEIEGRPLSKNMETLKQLEIEREPLYCRFADADIQNNVTLPEAAERIWEEYSENIGHERS